jgi:sterol desaturase/sphingolipid hydroxylase (fatty acid hydroxylase superfamily)
MHPVEHLVYFSCALTPLFFKVLPQPHRAIVHLHPHGSTHFPFTQAPFHMKWRRLTPLCSQMHPLCFVFNLFHAAISPMAGHDGLTGEVGGGGYGHYLHHAHYEVNYGTVKVPLDRVFGSWANDWPRKKPGAVPPPAGAKEFMQISVPLVMLAAAKGMAASLG